MNKNEVIAALHEGKVEISFLKKDNSVREMLCTLNHEYLPKIAESDESGEPKQKKARKKNLDVIAVYDLEKKAWRSFRYDSLVTFKTVQ